jgi:hypothetical protein
MDEVRRRMLIDSFAPNPDAVERHRISINASPEVVYHALQTADLGGSLIIKALMGLRSLPEFVLRRRHLPARDQKITLQTLVDAGFGMLAEDPGQEIVLGIVGRFWKPTGNVLPFDREAFDRPVQPGTAQGVWNFRVEPAESGQTILSTETRVTCGDVRSRRKFRVYWLFVRPFSGLIRHIMLRAVAKSVR